MLEINQLNLHFEEYSIRPDSAPGWEVVSAAVKRIAEAQLHFSSWIYRWKSGDQCYVILSKFSNKDAQSFFNSLNKHIFKDSICMIKTSNNPSIEQLIQNYSKASEGMITDNSGSTVFPAPIEVGDWTAVKESELVLVIHHDGDPLFILRK